ncbi:MAG: NAD-dependent epimerase/dehydratase family protein [Bdellovibrionales bacterium]
MANESFLITGAGGLIGRALTQKALTQGHRVVAVDRALEGVVSHPEVQAVQADCASDDFLETLSTLSFDQMIHCAAHPGGLSMQEPSENVRVNILGSMKLFEFCARKQKRILFLSSSVVYGLADHRKPIEETDQTIPATIYGIGKVACESFLSSFGQAYGLPWTCLRLFATYGAGHKPNLHQGILNVFLTQLRQGNHLAVKGSLERVRDLLYVQDAANAIYLAATSTKSLNRIYNIGSGQGHTVGELIEEVALSIGKNKSQIEVEVLPGVVGDTFYNVADISKAKNHFGFEPQYNLKSGLQEYVRDLNGRF